MIKAKRIPANFSSEFFAGINIHALAQGCLPKTVIKGLCCRPRKAENYMARQHQGMDRDKLCEDNRVQGSSKLKPNNQMQKP